MAINRCLRWSPITQKPKVISRLFLNGSLSGKKSCQLRYQTLFHIYQIQMARFRMKNSKSGQRFGSNGRRRQLYFEDNPGLIVLIDPESEISTMDGIPLSRSSIARSSSRSKRFSGKPGTCLIRSLIFSGVSPTFMR